jgi:hypothetical protein
MCIDWDGNGGMYEVGMKINANPLQPGLDFSINFM